MTENANTETNFTANREDIVRYMAEVDAPSDFLVPAKSPSDQTRAWVTQYVEAVTGALPGQADPTTVGAVLKEFMTLKADYRKNATDEIAENIWFFDLSFRHATFTSETMKVYVSATPEWWDEDGAEWSETLRDIANQSEDILKRYHARHLRVAVSM